MTYLSFLGHFREREVFSLGEIRLVEPSFHRTRLDEWQKKGYIRKLLRNYYMFDRSSPDEDARFRIANRIYPPSYVSLESALSRYGIIPERSLSVTSVSTRKTQSFDTFLGQFQYRTIAPKVFFGYAPAGVEKEPYLMACPPKALLDLIYLNLKSFDSGWLEGLRLNARTLWETTTRKNLTIMAGRFTNPKMTAAVKEVCRL